jgi:hypothetical protein
MLLTFAAAAAVVAAACDVNGAFSGWPALTTTTKVLLLLLLLLLLLFLLWFKQLSPAWVYNQIITHKQNTRTRNHFLANRNAILCVVAVFRYGMAWLVLMHITVRGDFC